MRNSMRCDELDKESDLWAASFTDDQICRLASSFRGGDECTMFKARLLRGLTLNFFVEFETGSERWVILVPNPVSIPKDMMDEKIEVEMATMRYVSAKTTIPVPTIRGYAFSDTSAIEVPFIIMDYVEGRTLKELGFNRETKEETNTWGHNWIGDTHTATLQKLHRQLADIYVQLRSLEFHRIGALGFPSRDAALTCNPDDIDVFHRPLSALIALDQLDGLEPEAMFPPCKTFPTAKDYVNALLWLADNRLERHEDNEMDEREPASILYAAHHFKCFVLDEWLNRSANEGPFVLTHAKLASETSHLLFDNDLNLVAVVGWEWSRVVPAQLMIPREWLPGSYTFDSLLLIKNSYKSHIRSLCEAVKKREKELRLRPVLSAEWAPLRKKSYQIALVRALEDSTYSYPVYWECIFEEQLPRVYNHEAPEYERETKWEHWLDEEKVPRIRAFMEASEERRAFLKRKIQDQLRFFEAEKEYYCYPKPRRIIKSRLGTLESLGFQEG